MEDHLRRLLEQFGIEIKTKKGWGSLLIGILLWVVVESLKDRLISAFNGWQDDHREKSMEYLGKFALWIVDHPYTWLVIVIIVILIDSARKSRNAEKDQAGEYNKPEDPRLMVAVVILEEGMFSGSPGIVVTNVGGSEANNLAIQKMTIAGLQVTFDSNIPALKPGDSTHPLVPIIVEAGSLFRHDLINLMLKEWGKQTGGIEAKLVFPAKAEYKNFKGKQYEATWDFELDPFKKWTHQNLRESIDTTGPYLTVSSVKNQKKRNTENS